MSEIDKLIETRYKLQQIYHGHSPDDSRQLMDDCACTPEMIRLVTALSRGILPSNLQEDILATLATRFITD